MKIVPVLSIAVATVAAGAAYFAFRPPASAPPKAVTVQVTPERLERGRYIFEVADCDGCHSERDWKKFSGPVLGGRRGAGVVFPAELGFPGSVVAPNITPDRETGIGGWTDGEKIRAIREGVSKDGRALFPFMPYRNFRSMSDEDVEALVAYMNSLAPVRNQLAQTKLNFPVNVLIKSAPQPVTQAVSRPAESDKLAHGKYLVTLAGCGGCHTQEENGQPKTELAFGGGTEFRLAGFTVRSANISPDGETGIGNWAESRFVEKFRGYANLTPETAPASVQANFTLMPWIAWSKLPDEDLRAIYAYLRTVKPIRNQVDPHKQLTMP